MSSETTQAPYATNGTDFRGALSHHYRVALKRFGKFFPAFFLLWIQLFVFRLGYLLPVAIIGFMGGLWTLTLFLGRMVRIWKCSRVFRTYPLGFRSPVEKVDQEGAHTLFLRLGTTKDSPTLRARNPLGGAGWPPGIAGGLWFAGDEPFGGAALVPDTGEMFFLQPRNWEQWAEERKNAGEERIRKAKHGGIKSPTRYR